MAGQNLSVEVYENIVDYVMTNKKRGVTIAHVIAKFANGTTTESIKAGLRRGQKLALRMAATRQDCKPSGNDFVPTGEFLSDEELKEAKMVAKMYGDAIMVLWPSSTGKRGKKRINHASRLRTGRFSALAAKLAELDDDASELDDDASELDDDASELDDDASELDDDASELD
jgi:hypothetical protein